MNATPPPLRPPLEDSHILSSTPLSHGKTNGTLSSFGHSDIQISPPSSPLKADPENNNNFSQEPEMRNKRPKTTDKAYFIAKELLATERTYKKDLDVISLWFREEVSSAEDMPEDLLKMLFDLVDPLSEAHTGFLRELEQRMAVWDGRGTLGGNLNENPRVIDLLLRQLQFLPLYDHYLDLHLAVLERLDATYRKNKKFEIVYHEFELQRVCYLPLSCFLIKPLQRLLHYYTLIDRLLKHYGEEHLDFLDCKAALLKLQPYVDKLPTILKTTENFVQLSELQRDMPSFEGLVQTGREFIRQGCLFKKSENLRESLRQRMVFLFSDVLVYTNRITNPQLQFKVRRQMPLKGIMVDHSDCGVQYSFTVFGGNYTLILVASSEEEKNKWLKDLLEAIKNAERNDNGKLLQYLSLKSCSSSDEAMEEIGSMDTKEFRERLAQHRSNTTVHVCWHRITSTCLYDHMRARSNEISGFLLRKFKNSDGWQKLWVVFTNFCLFFYKSYLEEAPLASLPLLGYTITKAGVQDDVGKEFVFKLQFKNHVYFFRAESEYTYSRWMEVILSATPNSNQNRNIFSRKNKTNYSQSP